MSRNASGTYSLIAGNPVVTGTVISSTWANNTLNDIATALTDSLDRTGKGAMTAALKLASGSAALPGLTFDSANNAGLSLLAAAGDVPAGFGMSYAGAEVARIATGQLYLSTGLLTGVAPLAPTATSFRLKTSVTNDPTYVNIVPNGTSNTAGIRAFPDDDLTAANVGIGMVATVSGGVNVGLIAPSAINSGQDMAVLLGSMDNGVLNTMIRIGHKLGAGTDDMFLGGPSVGGTNGYVYVQSKNASPAVGDIPAYLGGDYVPMYYDTANHRLYISMGGTWRYAQFAP
jgi:hypothetical protein